MTLSEVPAGISPTSSISNCRFRRAGCHSPNLQKDVGRCLPDDLDALTGLYPRLINCVCLMGEGRNWLEPREVLRKVRAMGLKTCLYSGSISEDPLRDFLPLLDSLKLGDYKKTLDE